MPELIRGSDMPLIAPGTRVSTGRQSFQFLGVKKTGDDRVATVFTPQGERRVALTAIMWASGTEPPRNSRDVARMARGLPQAQAKRPHRKQNGRQYLSSNAERVINALMDRDGPGCHYCGRDLDVATAAAEGFDGVMPKWWPTRDHKQPRALNGSNDLGNLVAACQKCNGDKADVPYDEYVAILAARGLGPAVLAAPMVEDGLS